jgi:haloalkane dehalogenase
MIKFTHTPDDRYHNLPDFPFTSNYLSDLNTYEGLRLHYLDEGPQTSDHTFLCLHGEPTWSYLYRKMIPVFVESGGRVIAPDLFGFGKSDKPLEDNVYTFHFHRNTIIEIIKKLDLKNITLVCQDWGGLLGLTIPMEMPKRFSRLIAMNTFLATGTLDLGEGFKSWKIFCNANPDLNISALMKRACPQLSDNEAAAYDAPFPDQSYNAGVRSFPNLVCDHPDAEGADLSRQAKQFWRTEWKGKAFMAIGMQDPVIPPPAMEGLHRIIKGCLPPFKLNEAGHFVQEHGAMVAKKALEAFSCR